MASADSGDTATRSWLRREQRTGSRAARAVLGLHLVGSVLGVGQSIAAASALTAAFGGSAVALPLIAFVVLAVLRASLFYLIEQTAFAAGGAAGRRPRGGGLPRLLLPGAAPPR